MSVAPHHNGSVGPAPVSPKVVVPAIALGVEDAVAALGISARLLTKLVEQNVVPSFTVGRRRLFAVEALQAWAAEQMASAAEDRGEA